jgi:hypothetical protein
MQQINRSTYIVDAGEVVTIQITATKVGEYATLSVDGAAPPVTGPLTFRLTVTAPSGRSHFGMISCYFPPTSPDDARYDVSFASSTSGCTFQGSDIKKSDPSHDRGFELRRL